MFDTLPDEIQICMSSAKNFHFYSWRTRSVTVMNFFSCCGCSESADRPCSALAIANVTNTDTVEIINSLTNIFFAGALIPQIVTQGFSSDAVTSREFAILGSGLLGIQP